MTLSLLGIGALLAASATLFTALKLVGAATFVEPDGSGRISIPASHRGAVGIEKKAVLVGMGDKFELWSEQAHHAQIRRTLSDDDLSEHMLDLKL